MVGTFAACGKPAARSVGRAPVPWAAMPRDRNLVTGTLAAIVAATLFGTLGPLARFAAQVGVEGVAFTSWRATLGVTFLVILIVARRGVGASLAALRSLDGRGRVALAIAALMGLLLNAAVFTAFERIPIALALMLFYTYPAGVVVVDAALGRETITPTRLLALLLSTTGVALVLAGGMTGSGGAPIDPIGVLLGLRRRGGPGGVHHDQPQRVPVGADRDGDAGDHRHLDGRRRAACRRRRAGWRRWSRRSGRWRRGRPCCSRASRRRGSRRCCS